MADSLDYWLERAQNTINSELIEDAKAAAELQRIVTLMYAEIAKELLAFYAKYATAEGLTIAEAKKIVDEFDVVAFQNKAKVLVKNKDFSKEANKQLKKYNTKMYVSREKLLKQNLDLLVTEASIKLENHIEKSLVKAIDREVERQSGILGTDINVTDKKIKAVVNSNFKGVTWSERLWDDMDLVRKEVERVATNVVNRGRHPNEYVADFKKKTGATTHDAKRLLVTESARVQTEAQKLSYLETLGEDGEYEFVAKRDEKTSKVCRHHDKKVYKVKDMVPGVNAPPMHPHCRSTTIPHIGNWRDDFFKKRKGKYKLDEEETTQLLAKK
ncbi:minor capsid protein, partial [Staphylococcus pseudintermedius]|nr:phage head morphogenesis protein [Staphylococcus pseudintermedius]EGQ2996052.1 phage head morphogenesis protein [Staphylococcus pseudintermedius]MDK3853650.1 minor capsid protein [Staphylococcus pseudintermedius]